MNADKKLEDDPLLQSLLSPTTDDVVKDNYGQPMLCYQCKTIIQRNMAYFKIGIDGHFAWCLKCWPLKKSEEDLNLQHHQLEAAERNSNAIIDWFKRWFS